MTDSSSCDINQVNARLPHVADVEMVAGSALGDNAADDGEPLAIGTEGWLAGGRDFSFVRLKHLDRLDQLLILGPEQKELILLSLPAHSAEGFAVRREAQIIKGTIARS